MSCRTYDPCLDSKLNQIGSYASVARQSAQSATASAAAADSDATAAAASAAAAAASAEIAGIYLGPFATPPTVDNQGGPLQEGMLYYNTVSNTLFVWNGSSWSAIQDDEIYLGGFAVAPTLNNQGLPLVNGNMYWNTVSNNLFTWNGSAWIQAFGQNYLGGFAVAPVLNNQGLPLVLGNLYWNSVTNNLWAYNGVAWIVTNFNETTPFLATGTTFARTLANRFADVVNVKDFGAVGDGIVNDTAAIQAAIDFASTLGGIVMIPEGRYLLTSTVSMRSNVYVKCESGTIFDVESFTANAIQFYGSAGSEIPITTTALSGQTSLTVASPLNVGDTIIMISVRNALSADDAGDWWLGGGTASLQYAYYTEWNTIAENTSGTTYRLSSPIIMEEYAANASGETFTNRTTSAVRKITPITNATWDGGEFFRTIPLGGHILRTFYAVGCTIKNVITHKGNTRGGAVSFFGSNNCKAENCVNNNDPTLVWDYSTYHGILNRFFVVGSQDCGFDNIKDSYAAQSVDFTYSSGADFYTNIRPFCINSNFDSCFEGLTSHPGSYLELWDSNTISNCQGENDGIIARGNRPVITNNKIYGSQGYITNDLAIGEAIGLQYGGPKRAVVRNNVIRGFRNGIAIKSSPTLQWQWRNCDVDISDNHISDCYTGLLTDFANLEKTSGRFITYANNVHSRMVRYVVELSEYSAHTVIRGNVLSGDFKYTGVGAFVAFLEANNENPAITFQGNIWDRTLGGNAGKTKYLCFIASLSDTTTYPFSDFGGTVVVINNVVAYDVIDGVITLIGTSAYRLNKHKDPTPFTDQINAGALPVPYPLNGISYSKVNTEGSAATDDLDQIIPLYGGTFNEGDIINIRPAFNTRMITLRDVSVSGAASFGIETPGNADIVCTTSNNVIQLLFNGTHWCVISSETTT